MRFTRLVFGLRPSPAMLGSMIRHHLEAQLSEEFNMELIERLKNSLYVDDLVTREANDNQVLDLCSKSKSILQQGGFNLRKWNTNSTVVREAINQSTRRVMPPSVFEGAKSVTKEDESYAKATTVNDDKTADRLELLGATILA